MTCTENNHFGIFIDKNDKKEVYFGIFFTERFVFLLDRAKKYYSIKFLH